MPGALRYKEAYSVKHFQHYSFSRHQSAMHLELGLPDAGMKAKDSPDRRAYDLLSKGFGEGFNGKLTIVADAKGVKGNKSEAFQDAVNEMKDLHNVASVTPMPNEKGLCHYYGSA